MTDSALAFFFFVVVAGVVLGMGENGRHRDVTENTRVQSAFCTSGWQVWPEGRCVP